MMSDAEVDHLRLYLNHLSRVDPATGSGVSPDFSLLSVRDTKALLSRLDVAEFNVVEDYMPVGMHEALTKGMVTDLFARVRVLIDKHGREAPKLQPVKTQYGKFHKYPTHEAFNLLEAAVVEAETP